MKQEEKEKQNEQSEAVEQEQQQQPESVITPTKTTVILRAATPEAIDEQVAELKANNADKTITSGSMSRSKKDGTYKLRIDMF